jgi:DNA-directed RNA polymerase, mitochondrial
MILLARYKGKSISRMKLDQQGCRSAFHLTLSSFPPSPLSSMPSYPIHLTSARPSCGFNYSNNIYPALKSHFSTLSVPAFEENRIDNRNEETATGASACSSNSPSDLTDNAEKPPQLSARTDLAHINLVNTIKHIPNRVKEILDKAKDDESLDGDIKAVNEHSGLFIRQLKIEEEQQDEAVKSYQQAVEKLLQIGKGTGIKHIQRIVLKWYEPLCESIAGELKLVVDKVHGNNRTGYGPWLFVLPIDKLAVITIDTTLTAILRCGNDGAEITKIAYSIGNLIETETNLMKLKQGKSKDLNRYDAQLVLNSLADKKFAMKMQNKLRIILDEDTWPMKIKVQLGAVLLELLLNIAKSSDNLTNAMSHAIEYSAWKNKKIGILRMDASLYKDLVSKDINQILPRYLPMLVEPKEWDYRKKAFGGVYYRLRADIMRTFSKGHMEALSRANMRAVLDGLNYLGKLPWKINKPILEVIQACWSRKLALAEIPPSNDIPYPSVDDFTTISIDPITKASVKLFDQQKYDRQMKRIQTRNAELHSLRCDFRLKMQIAEKFQDDAIYFPWNLDFRGRAYPIPQNLSHLGSDLCRGLLKFSVGKALGKDGLFWLKVHLANLYGNNKISLKARAQWVDDHLPEVYESANNPLDGKRWWVHADEPFQCLATCMEIVAAIESKEPEKFISCLPIHQDGSCNGLQHYAALGRDALGGRAVNLLPTDDSGPQDVYSKVLDIVLLKIDQHCAILDELEQSQESISNHPLLNARMVKSHVNRKVIKQTVMTSVYGVTPIGARAQVQARLHDRFSADISKISSPELDRQLFHAAGYVAKLTLESLSEMFSSAQAIKAWLATSARLVATQGHVMSWITPLGLPVMQPYRQLNTYQVNASLQKITLAKADDHLPVLRSKQGTAFSPNFVHSLDASHMLMTALKMKEKNLSFTAVHDSYWTHACDVPVMAELLRDCFVELYKKPVLEELYESLRIRYPDIEFPELPERGDLDINQVKNSTYFFH